MSSFGCARFGCVSRGYRSGIKGRKALVVEDDETFRRFVTHVLGRAGLDVIEACDGAEGVRALYELRPDVIAMDLTMPEMDGWTLLERIREVTDVPVLVISGLVTETEKVRALQAGADDYMTKPFGPQELQARVAALLRRSRATEGVETLHDDGVLRIDAGRMEARLFGRPIELTPREFRLLSVFSRHPGQTLSAVQLAEMTWGDWRAADERVKVVVSRLRAKCARTGGELPVMTVRGFGYRYEPPSGA